MTYIHDVPPIPEGDDQRAKGDAPAPEITEDDFEDVEDEEDEDDGEPA